MLTIVFAAAGWAALSAQAQPNTMTAKKQANLKHVLNCWLECLEGGHLEIQAAWKNKPKLMFGSGAYVFLVVKRAEKAPDNPNQTGSAHWFGMVGVENGMIQENWDAATKNAPQPGRGR